jgi:nickel/cobalt exporter
VRLRRLGVVAAGTACLVLGPVTAASAHPLGNFTVNHYDGLTLTPTGVRDLAVIDAAEIPTAQAEPGIDTNHDGSLESSERAHYATVSCARLAPALRLDVDGIRRTLKVAASSYQLRPGAAGLSISRLVCRLAATADLTGARHTVAFADGFDAHRIGWHEITAVPAGVHLDRSPVPTKSVSDQLLHYPNALLSSPLDVRAATITVLPGNGLTTFAAGLAKVPGAGPLARLVDRLNTTFSGLAGARHLTLGVGLLAVAVSLLLGASHAALPGHGKTVMAAYLAGKRGRVRDAVVVGTTVTLTHTAGVLILGVALTLSSSLAGDEVVNSVGVASGALVCAIGVSLLVSALRRGRSHTHDHDHDHGHDHPHPHPHPHEPAPIGRTGLIGMGIAGGLVPSPSALVVLLGAVALGRTLFGVLLVVTYGLGMAGTLTAAGLLAVRLADRIGPRLARMRLTRRIGTATPVLTAGLVVAVGLGLAVRSLAVV